MSLMEQLKELREALFDPDPDITEGARKMIDEFQKMLGVRVGRIRIIIRTHVYACDNLKQLEKEVLAELTDNE